jgi:hypothetical protein
MEDKIYNQYSVLLMVLESGLGTTIKNSDIEVREWSTRF